MSPKESSTVAKQKGGSKRPRRQLVLVASTWPGNVRSKHEHDHCRLAAWCCVSVPGLAITPGDDGSRITSKCSGGNWITITSSHRWVSTKRKLGDSGHWFLRTGSIIKPHWDFTGSMTAFDCNRRLIHQHGAVEEDWCISFHSNKHFSGATQIKWILPSDWVILFSEWPSRSLKSFWLNFSFSFLTVSYISKLKANCLRSFWPSLIHKSTFVYLTSILFILGGCSSL